MLNRIVISLVTFFTFSFVAVAGEFPDVLNVSNTELNLNGSGFRKKVFIKLYNTALYLGEASTDGTVVTAADETQVIELVVVSKLATASKVRGALEEGMQQSTNNQTEAIVSEIDTFLAVFSNGVEKGDRFSFTYTPERGTEVTRNKEQQAVIDGLAFKQALFGIWLSANPVDKKLKAKLLGQ